MKYYVIYNGATMARYMSIKPATNFINRRGYKNNYSNQVYIMDSNGTPYTPEGQEIEDFGEWEDEMRWND